MSFRSILRDVRDSIGSLSRRTFEFRVSNIHKERSQCHVYELHDQSPDVQQSRWACLPPELLGVVIKKLDASESNWPSRKYVVACAAVCKSWRAMCIEVVRSPELCGKLTFPISLKQPGPRDGTIQCFIKRDKHKMKYHLYLCLSPVLVENGKFLLSAKRCRRTTFTEYKISMHSTTRSSNTYIGKLRSNFLGTKFIIYDTHRPYNAVSLHPPAQTSRRFYSKKVSPKVPNDIYNIGQVSYELNVLGTRGPRSMRCIMYSIPAAALDAGGSVPGQCEHIVARSLEDSFRSMSSIIDRSMDFSSARFSDISGGFPHDHRIEDITEQPLMLRNKVPRWHEQLQCWCLNFRGRVTVASVKNFQLIAANQPAACVPAPSHTTQADHDKVILQFGKVAEDVFTMDYRYPLSAFHAFAICLSSFDTKLACE